MRAWRAEGERSSSWTATTPRCSVPAPGRSAPGRRPPSCRGTPSRGPLPGTEILPATFAEDGTLPGSAGCNTYRTTYTTDKGGIEIDPAVVDEDGVRRAGGDHEAGAAFLTALPQAVRFEVAGPTLDLLTTEARSSRRSSPRRRRRPQPMGGRDGSSTCSKDSPPAPGSSTRTSPTAAIRAPRSGSWATSWSPSRAAGAPASAEGCRCSRARRGDGQLGAECAVNLTAADHDARPRRPLLSCPCATQHQFAPGHADRRRARLRATLRASLPARARRRPLEVGERLGDVLAGRLVQAFDGDQDLCGVGPVAD